MFERKAQEPSKSAPIKCPKCHGVGFLMQSPISQATNVGIEAIGAVVKCFHCTKMFAVIEGGIVTPSWMADLELQQEKQKAELEAQRAELRERMKGRVPEGDLKWEPKD